MRPNRPRALRRVFSSTGVRSMVMFAVLFERVVGAESVWSDDEIAVLAGRERNGHGRWQATRRASLIEHLPDGADVNGVAFQDLDEGILQGIGPGGVEELE